MSFVVTPTQQSNPPANPRMGTAEMILALVGTLIGAAIGFFTAWFPSNIADSHSGIGGALIGIGWLLLMIAFWAFVGGALGWQLSGRSLSTPNFVRKLPGTALAAGKWAWGRSRGRSMSKIGRRVWLLFGLLLGFYAGMTNRHWANVVNHDVYRFALKLVLVLAGMLIGYLVFAWIHKMVTGLVTKVKPQPAATASSTSTAQTSPNP